MMKLFVGAAILVDYGASMTQREDCGDRNAIFAGQADLYVGTQAGNKVPKPCAGLREKSMPPPGDHEQLVKVIEKTLGTAFIVGKLFALGSPYPTLDAVLMHAVENLLD